MEHYQRIQQAIDFIEEHLNETFTLRDVSRAAFSSLSYFHRVFYFMTGFTLKEYIRKRRLSTAAHQLLCTKTPISTIAFDAAYKTHESFTRAFKKQFGSSPRDFRKTQQEHPLFKPLDILAEYASATALKNDFELCLNFVAYKAAVIKGFQIQTTIENGQHASDICAFSNRIISSHLLEMHFDTSTTETFGVYTNMTDENEFDYTIGCLKTSCTSPSIELVSHTLPSSQYAKFTLSNTSKVKEAWHYIYGVWFPKNQAERTTGLDFETYQKDKVDIYIPMQKKP